MTTIKKAAGANQTANSNINKSYCSSLLLEIPMILSDFLNKKRGGDNE
jgi:hypothetical protein